MWQNVNIWGIWVGTVRKLFTPFCNFFVSQNKFLFYVRIKSEKFKTPLGCTWMVVVNRGVGAGDGQGSSQETWDLVLDPNGGRDAQGEGRQVLPMRRERGQDRS